MSFGKNHLISGSKSIKLLKDLVHANDVVRMLIIIMMTLTTFVLPTYLI